jgi:hypothetical protein
LDTAIPEEVLPVAVAVLESIYDPGDSAINSTEAVQLTSPALLK